jgi:hypothetical protein
MKIFFDFSSICFFSRVQLLMPNGAMHPMMLIFTPFWALTDTFAGVPTLDQVRNLIN